VWAREGTLVLIFAGLAMAHDRRDAIRRVASSSDYPGPFAAVPTRSLAFFDGDGDPVSSES